MQLYTWGSNKYGQLGLGDTSIAKAPRPTRVPFAQQVTKVRCGYKSSLLLTKNSECFSCGSGGAEAVPGFRAVAGLPPVEKIFCTNFFAVLTRDNSVYVWGSTPLWQFPQPAALEEFRGNAADVAIGNDFILVVDFDFLIYSAGRNDKGQLGYENTIENADFKCIERLSSAPLKVIACGADFCLGISGINPKLGAGAQGGVSPAPEEASRGELGVSRPASLFQNPKLRTSTVSQMASQMRSPDFPGNGDGGSQNPVSPANRLKNRSVFSNMPRVHENEEEEAKLKKTVRNDFDWSRERAELEEIERAYLERIAPKGFHNSYVKQIDELRVG